LRADWLRGARHQLRLIFNADLAKILLLQAK
jgi:hypothetical protein